MGFLQKPMRGLRDFLGEFTPGHARFDSTQAVLPTYDIGEFTAEPEWVSVGLTSVAVISQYVLITVPENEMWRVYSVHASTDIMGSTEGGRLLPCIRPARTGSAYPLYGGSSTLYTGANAVCGASFSFGKPATITEGMSVGAMWIDFNGVATNVQTAAHIQRLRI